MSSSPWEWLWNGDEDVATPFHAGAVSRGARLKAGCPHPAQPLPPAAWGHAAFKGSFQSPGSQRHCPLWKGLGAAMSSSPWGWLWNGDEDVATPFHAGAVSRGAHLKAGCPHPAQPLFPAAWGHAAYRGSFQSPVPRGTAPLWKGFGAAMSSSPWGWLRNGDEDVATPFHAGAVSRCAHLKAGCPHPAQPLPPAAWGHAAFKGSFQSPVPRGTAPFGKDSGWRCPHRLGDGFETATRTSPPRSMRGQCQEPPA
jgi:hypothetical protein